MALTPGSSFGAYRIIEPLGRGGMASVYKAYEAGLDRYVALKVLPAEFLDETNFAERFEREAKLVARLEHPNIVPIFAFGIAGRVPWMAMRLIKGGGLSALINGRPLDPRKVVVVMRSVADALEYAHGHGIIHRDVKPQNILLDESDRVYLADFGIARMIEGTSALTQTGMISGTPQYMAPEHARGATLDHRCDIYSLGVVAYEMLTGRVPFTADTPVAVLLKHIAEPIPLPSPDEVPEPLLRPLLKCLAKGPADRWPQATDFAHALEQGLAKLSTHVSLPAPPTVQLPAPARQTLAPPPPQKRAPTLPPRPGVAAPGASRAPLTPAWLAALGASVAALGVVALLLVGAWVMRRPEARTAPETPAPAMNESVPSTPTPEPPVTTIGGAETSMTIAPAPPVPALELPPKALIEGGSRAGGTRPARTASAIPPSSTSSSSERPTPSLLPTPEIPSPLVREPEPAPYPPPAPSLDLDLEAVQDPESEWGTETLYLQMKIDDKLWKELSVTFSGPDRSSRIRRRERLHIEDAPVGSHKLTLLASSHRNMLGALIQGSTQVNFRDGVNTLSIQVRYLGPDDWSMKFR